jgi:hypothetical protein
MADCVPSLVGLHSADRGDRNPALVGVGVGHHPLGPVEQHEARTPFGLDQPLPPAHSEGIPAISGPRYSWSAASSTRSRPHLVHVEDAGGTQLSQEMAERAREIASAYLLTPDPVRPEPGLRAVRSVDRTQTVKPHLTTMMGSASGRPAERTPGHSAPPTLTPVHPGCGDR